MTTSASALGAGVGPTVLLASQLSPTTFQVAFSEPMATSGVTAPANYTLTANGGSIVRSVTFVAPLSLSSVVVTVNGALSVGVNAYTVTVTGVSDIVGNNIDTSANSANLTVVGTTSSAHSRDGGSYATLGLPTIVSPGRYHVHVGPLGTSADPRAYSRVAGEAEFVRLAAGQTSVSVALPSAATVGNNRIATFIAIDPTASPSTFQSLNFVDFLPRQYFSSALSMRRLFPYRYDIGFIDPASEAAQ